MPDVMPFEKALERLDKIVQELESGDVKLEDALKKYEEGVKLVRLCQGRLGQAEKKIEVLSRSLDGDLTKEPFEMGETDAGGRENGKPAARAKATRAETEDGDLLL
jgi:exodeoxyribonuclease VII small subunit